MIGFEIWIWQMLAYRAKSTWLDALGGGRQAAVSCRVVQIPRCRESCSGVQLGVDCKYNYCTAGCWLVDIVGFLAGGSFGCVMGEAGTGRLRADWILVMVK